MGGNAFEQTDRLTATQYSNICDDLGWLLRNVLIEGRHFAIPHSVREKESHGDVDILVVGSKIENALRQIQRGFLVDNLISNPNGYNILAQFEGLKVQIDLNKIGDDDIEFGFSYFSWNDLGNLIGRIAHRQGLKHGHDGLWYVHRDGDHQLGEILLTKSYDDALLHLGFDADKFWDGFDTFDEMFAWVEGSRFFEACSFPLEHRNHQARMRDAKRKTYKAFLERINFDGEWVESDKKMWLERHIRRFPHLGTEIKRLNTEHYFRQQAKEKLNGIIVRDLTGLEGKELGKLMQIVNRVLPQEAVLKHDPVTIESGIMFAFQIYKEENR